MTDKAKNRHIGKNDLVPMERRAFVVDELRVEKRGGKPTISGHAAVFEQLSDDLGGFREKIRSGAFTRAIAEDDVRALFNHDSNYVLGRNRSGTLRMSEDEQGLLVEIDPPDTQFARDLLVSMERGDITQMSFGFTVRSGGQIWEEEEGASIRTLTDVRLYDVSPVTFPAYPQTDVAVRAFREHLEEAEQAAEDAIRKLQLKRKRLALLSRLPVLARCHS